MNHTNHTGQIGEGKIWPKLIEADLSDTALRGSAFPESEASSQVASEAKDNFGKNDDVRWQNDEVISRKAFIYSLN